MPFSNLLDFVREITALAEKIDGRIRNVADGIYDKGPGLEEDKWYFTQYFLSRDIEYGKSIVLLAEENFSYTGVVVGRTMLEAWSTLKHICGTHR